MILTNYKLDPPLLYLMALITIISMYSLAIITYYIPWFYSMSHDEATNMANL